MRRRGAPLTRVAAHADTVKLLEAILGDGAEVVEVERSDEAARADLLARGAVDGVQCYHTTEPLSFFGPGGGLDARGFELAPLCATAPGGLGPRPRRSTASRVAATPRLRRAYSVETSRGDAAAAT